MNIDVIPIWLFFLGTVVLVMVSIEVGHRLGALVRRSSPDERESTVSSITGAALGLTAFVLAFTFSIVSNRYDSRKELVREEANAIGTALLRTDFLPESDRAQAVDLFKKYLDLRLGLARSNDLDQGHLDIVLAETESIQHQLWDMAVVNGRKDMDSDVGALYVDSLNSVFDVHALRLAVGIQSRVANGIWAVLYSITILGMMGLGYQTGITGSGRSLARVILALSFSLVFMLIATLDRPANTFIKVSQQPLIDLRNSMNASVETGIHNP